MTDNNINNNEETTHQLYDDFEELISQFSQSAYSYYTPSTPSKSTSTSALSTPAKYTSTSALSTPHTSYVAAATTHHVIRNQFNYAYQLQEQPLQEQELQEQNQEQLQLQEYLLQQEQDDLDELEQFQPTAFTFVPGMIYIDQTHPCFVSSFALQTPTKLDFYST
jgi:hypothetical protein